ncbi:hypothetical protein ACHQM5_001821 [Ranunculus cassubicifolius]
MDSTSTNNSVISKSRKNLTNEERQNIFEAVSKQCYNGKIKKGAFTNVAALFSVTPRTIQKIWMRGKTCIDNGVKVDVAHRLTERTGRKRIQIDPRLISGSKETSIRSLAKTANMAKSTVHRRIKEARLNKLPPTEENHLIQGDSLPLQVECDAELVENSRAVSEQHGE